MATTLQQQLAAIAAKSTHQLDLKAQKARHGKSLLFEPRDAASQSFDTIYQICYEGFEELCMLDARFGSFGRNLFSEQSKNEDRTQMTAAENEELDKTIESFLGLLSGRLLLKPAMKAVEWLVRRFRSQEYNTEAVLLTFLPYHTSHIFPTLLSILPEQLPPIFRFLHPYVASLQSPPRHAVLAAAINNQGFFSAFSQYVLRVAKARHHSTILLGFWASITAQAVNGMIDATRSGRDAVRKTREEDLLLRVLPILQSALSIKGVPDLYMGACMIMIIIATKASLEDRVLDAMMAAVAGAWTSQTVDEGLMCLAVIAEEKNHGSVPKSVTKAVLGLEGPVERLRSLSERHRAGKLVLCLAVGAFDCNDEALGVDGTSFAKEVIVDEIMSHQYVSMLAEELLLRIKDSTAESPHAHALMATLEELTDNAGIATVLQEAARRSQIDLNQLNPRLAITGSGAEAETPSEDSDAADLMDLDEPSNAQNSKLGPTLKALPDLKPEHLSFLDPAHDDIFGPYRAAIQVACNSDQSIRRILSLQALRRNEWSETPTFLTFLVRVWSSSPQALARVKALTQATSQLESDAGKGPVDLQALLPYVITALADSAQRVRRAAASLCKVIMELYGIGNGKEKVEKDIKTWCEGSVYGAKKAQALPAQDAHKFLTSAIVPVLEDCVLDGDHIVRAMSHALKGSPSVAQSAGAKETKEMKSSLRIAVCDYLASHVVATPVLTVKARLLPMLSRAGKAAGAARKSILLPLVKEWTVLGSDQLEPLLSAEYLSRRDLDRVIIGSLSSQSTEEISALQSIAAGDNGVSPGMSLIAFEHLRSLWSSMKANSQVTLADWLLELAVGDTDAQTDALETLRNLHYTTEVLVHLVHALPSASDLQDKPSSAKRQRTSKAEDTHSKADTAPLLAAVKRITLVLELVEGAKPEKHTQLLKGLFNLLSELHHYKTLLGSQLLYLQGLLMSDLLSVVKGLQGSPVADIDSSVIRPDLIVECVRTTSSTQVHNTALLLISSLASWAPGLVLHSVMPLFTFMSTTLLRQGDEYSAHVTDQTVSRLVPPLAASLKKRGKDLVSGASELLLSFTAAFEHIPLHRRAGLFQHLVQTLGADESLFAVSTMLIERYPTDDRVQPFVGELMAFFPVATQLRALTQYLDLVFDALKPKRALSDTILSLGEKNADQIEDSVDTMLQALAKILADKAFRKRVAKGFGKGGAEADALRNTYAQLLDQTMRLASQVASNEDMEGMEDTSEAVLSSLLGLTPTKDFIETSAQLMQTGSTDVRRQVFRSLEARVTQAKRGDATLRATFLEVLPNCCVFIDSNQPISVRHAAIACVDQIAEKYGRVDTAAVLNAAQTVAGDAALGSEDGLLKAVSIYCLATMVEVLGEEFIPMLPSVLSKILGYAEETQAGSRISDLRLVDAGFSFVSAVMDHLNWMFSQTYLERVLLIAGNADSSVFPVTDDFGVLAAKRLNAEILFAAVDQTFEAVTDLGPEASAKQLRTLQAIMHQHTRKSVMKSSGTVFSTVLKAFDLRRLNYSEEDEHAEEYAEVLHLVNEVAIDMTLNLDPKTFRPFFIRFVEWAVSGLPKADAKGRILRATSFYSYAHLLFEKLQSITTSYTSFFLDHAAELLNTLPLETQPEHELLHVVLQTLSSSFRHDQDDFWQSPSHFDAIATPLLALLSKPTTHQVTTTHIIPTLTDLASAAGSPDHHKALNSHLMQYVRHEQAAVRLAAVKTERAITERLGLDWLALLPEMLPVISELQEDDDETVEGETLRWVRQIEGVTGESLEGMLQ